MNVKHSSCHHSRQAFLQRRAQRNARRFVRAMMNVGIGIGWDGKHLPLTSRLPARSRHHLVRLGAEIVRHLQHLAQPAAEPAASELVQWLTVQLPAGRTDPRQVSDNKPHLNLPVCFDIAYCCW